MLKLALAFILGWIICKFKLEAKIINGIVKGITALYYFIKGWIKKEE